MRGALKHLPMRKPCIEALCPGYEYRESRCEWHYKATQRARNSNPLRANYSSPEYRRSRLLAFMNSGGLCAICGLAASEADPLTADHIRPLALGGSNAYDNIQAAHRSCNSAKRDHFGR